MAKAKQLAHRKFSKPNHPEADNYVHLEGHHLRDEETLCGYAWTGGGIVDTDLPVTCPACAAIAHDMIIGLGYKPNAQIKRLMKLIDG